MKKRSDQNRALVMDALRGSKWRLLLAAVEVILAILAL